MVEIRKVVSRRDYNRFFSFPNTLYKDNPYYVPALSHDEKHMFDAKRNPAFAYTDTIAFLAVKDGKVAGRIAALVNHKLNDEKQQRQMRFTRFDVIDDVSVSEALFDAVSNWGTSMGMEEIVGPLGFTELDKQGMLIEGFDQMGMPITLYNHPYYQRHMEQLGFTKDVDWVEYKIFVPEKSDERIERICEIAKKRHGYRLLEFKRKRDVIPYARSMFRMYNSTFADFYGFCPLNEEQIEMVIRQFIGMVNLEYVFIVVDAHDTVIGFGIMVPSLAKAVKRSNGRLLPFGLFRIMHALKHSDVLDMYLIAVHPDYFGRGVNAVILNEGIKRAIANGVKYAESGPEFEDNEHVQSQWKSFEVEQHKRRRCYHRTLDG